MPTAPPRFGAKAATAKPDAWSHQGKTTTQRGYGWQHQKDRERLLRDEPLCRECTKHGRVTSARIADHVIPLAEGGSRTRANLQPLCRACSDAKTKAEAQRGRQAL
jgi:5-methylcytosine-specific restriction protein A